MGELSRLCYICMDEEGAEAEWVSPCRCAGSIRWVHQRCLMRWVTQHEASRPRAPLVCPTCRTSLRLEPGKGALLRVADYLDSRVCPTGKYVATWLFGHIAFDSICVSLGMFTHAQLYGLEATIGKLSTWDKFETITFLHFMSVSILLVNVVPWERYLLKGLRRMSRLPGGKWVFPEEVPERFRLPEKTSFGWAMVNSALLPIYSSAIGNIFFSFIDSRPNRVVLGGLVFLGVKGCLSMYFLQKREVRRKNLTITHLRTESASTNNPE